MAKKTAKRTAAKPAATTKVRTTRVTARQETGLNKFLTRGYWASLSWGALAAELLGTFVLALFVLNTANVQSGLNYILVFFGLITLVVAFLPLSGAHFNPVLTAGMWAVRRMRGANAVAYVVAQVLGAMLALVVASSLLADTVNPLTGQAEQGQVYAAQALPSETDDKWRLFAVEAIGTAVFAFVVVSAYLSRAGAVAKGFAYAGGFLVGALLLQSTALMNPALALSLQALKFETWSLAIFLLAPLVGAIVAMLLNRLMQRDADLKA